MNGIENNLLHTREGVTLMREAGEVIASIQKNAAGVENAVKDVALAVKAG